MTSGSHEPYITVENVSVIKAKKKLLDDVSLRVLPNDFITIIGPNGAGKTTLLHVLLGLVKPTSGTVEKQSKLKISYIPQSLHIDKTLPMTVKRFLQLAGKVAASDILEVLQHIGIAHLDKQILSQLSGGEFQRVLLARSLLQKPDILLLDEPAQNLDVGGQLAFYKLLEDIYKEGKTSIVMVSHDIHLVLASSSQVICLYHHICCSGEPSYVTQDPKFKELFGEDMVDMMAVYHHAHQHTHSDESSHEH